MALTAEITGTVENSDVQRMVIARGDDGTLVGTVAFKVTIDGVTQERTASWTLTTYQQNTIVSSFLASAKSAIATHLGL